jgi:NitT/TauT family transport system substrate-binding protein
MVAVTGYNLRGSLNQVVVRAQSSARTLADLTGQRVSTSLGSAGDGMLSTALQRNDIDKSAVQILNQDPAVGAAAVDGGQVDALAQFVPWPQLVIFRNQGRLLYDGGDNEVPTFHGVVVRKQFAQGHPEVMDAFLQAVKATTDYIVTNPLQAAQRVSALTGIEPEVVYLYNGPNGLVSFDMTLKPQLVAAFAKVKDYLVKRGSVTPDFDVDGFVNDGPLRQLFGPGYAQQRDDLTNPTALRGTDDICRLPVGDPAQASELWAVGDDATQVSATPTCLLRRVATTAQIRAAYVPDAATGIRLFADHAAWVVDPSAPATQRFKPFATEAGADTYLARHPEATELAYPAAVAQSRSSG